MYDKFRRGFIILRRHQKQRHLTVIFTCIRVCMQYQVRVQISTAAPRILAHILIIQDLKLNNNWTYRRRLLSGRL